MTSFSYKKWEDTEPQVEEVEVPTVPTTVPETTPEVSEPTGFNYKKVEPATPEIEAEFVEYTQNKRSNPSWRQDWDANYLPSNKDDIRAGMAVLRGVEVNDWDDQKLFDEFMEMNRGLDMANSVRLFNVNRILNRSSEEELVQVGRMFQVWQEMPGANKPEGEGSKAFWDYTEAILTDPINYVPFALGKLVGWGAKSSSLATTNARLKALNPLKSKRTFAEATKVYEQSMKAASIKANESLAKRTATTQATKGLAKLVTPEALKEYAVAVPTEMAISAGTEYFYQKAYVKTGQQDQIYMDRLGLQALGAGLIATGAVAMNLARGASGFKPTTSLPKPTQDKKKVFNNLAILMEDAKKNSSWAEKVAKGVELEDLDFEFWTDMTSRMVASLADDGIVPPKDYPENFGNWLADMVAEGDPVDGRRLLQEFSNRTGIRIRALEEENSLEVFANMFAKHYSMAGSSLGDLGRAAQKLGKDASVRDILREVTRENAEEQMSLLERLSRETQAAGAKVGKLGADTQTNIIRGIVSNLSTTRLNLVGYGISTIENSIVDTAKGVLTLPAGAAKLLMSGDDKLLRKGFDLINMQRQKLLNTLDMGTTFDQYQALIALKGDDMAELSYTISGGVENLDELIKARGLDPNDSFINAGVTKLADVAQYLNLVQAQDALTKSIEYTYQLDKNLRLSVGRSLSEILADPQAAKLINQPAFQDAQAAAIYETGRAIYSTSYRRLPIIGGLAGGIEDFRKFPIIGLNIPFGKFFNNVVAKTVDYSGASMGMKLLGNMFVKEGAIYGNRSYGDLFVRAALAWTVVGALTDKQEEYIDRGLGTYEYEDPKDNLVKDGKWTYPISAYLAVSRIAAYKGRDIPEDEYNEVVQHLRKIKAFGAAMDFTSGTGEIPVNTLREGLEFIYGNLTRDLNEATVEFVDTAIEIMRNPETAQENLWSLLGESPMVNVTQGATRWLEPANAVMHLVTNTPIEDVRDGDRKWNEATKYISYWAGDSEEPGFSVGFGEQTPDLEKYISDRTVLPTNVQRVGNLVGEELWRLNKFSDSAKANNMYEQVFNSILEEKATDLWYSEKFQNAPLAFKQQMWGKVKTRAAETAMNFLKTESNKSSRYALILEINQAGENKLSMAMKRLDPTGELDLQSKRLDELSSEQLLIIKNYMDWGFKSFESQ